MPNVSNMPKAGTGDELVRIPLGELGELIIEDDGDPDRYLNVVIEAPTGERNAARSAMMAFRQSKGGVALERELQAVRDAVVNGPDSSGSGGSGSTDYGIGIFVCDDCHLSWPRKKDQTPDSSVDTCPECYEGDA